MGFWEDIYELRKRGLIPRQWSRADIRQHLSGKYAPNTLNSLPSNQSMTRDGDEKGNYILRGLEPKAWRITAGIFELIKDPEDNCEMQQSQIEEGYRIREKTLDRLEPKRERLVANRMGDLCEEFLTFVELGKQKYTGPSVYFHCKTVSKFQELGSNVLLAAKDQRFCELLYATLVSWGMHGMRAAKMPDFEPFSEGIAKLSPKIHLLSGYQLGTLSQDDIHIVGNQVWELILELPGSLSESSRIVANSKLLHHLLPELVPPIDRGNTGPFFQYVNQADFQGREKQIFWFIFPRLNSIARNVKHILNSFTYEGFNSSPTKVIDNAINGFVEKNDLKGERKRNRAKTREWRLKVGHVV